MISAYVTLGVPGNATTEDIEAALARARDAYTAARMADDSQVAERFVEVMNAYKVLRDPESRAAHDRKLAAQVHVPRSTGRVDTRPRFEEREERSGPRPMVVVAVVVLALFGGGFFVQYQRRAEQADLAAKALETARLQAVAEEEGRKTADIEAREQARKDSLAQQQERALRRDADASIARARSEQSRQDSINAQKISQEQREARRLEQERIADEQRRASEGQRRVAQDKQRIRELCYTNYRRYDC